MVANHWGIIAKNRALLSSPTKMSCVCCPLRPLHTVRFWSWTKDHNYERNMVVTFSLPWPKSPKFVYCFATFWEHDSLHVVFFKMCFYRSTTPAHRHSLHNLLLIRSTPHMQWTWNILVITQSTDSFITKKQKQNTHTKKKKLTLWCPCPLLMCLSHWPKAQYWSVHLSSRFRPRLTLAALGPAGTLHPKWCLCSPPPAGTWNKVNQLKPGWSNFIFRSVICCKVIQTYVYIV